MLRPSPKWCKLWEYWENWPSPSDYCSQPVLRQNHRNSIIFMYYHQGRFKTRVCFLPDHVKFQRSLFLPLIRARSRGHFKPELPHKNNNTRDWYEISPSSAHCTNSASQILRKNQSHPKAIKNVVLLWKLQRGLAVTSGKGLIKRYPILQFQPRTLSPKGEGAYLVHSMRIQREIFSKPPIQMSAPRPSSPEIEAVYQRNLRGIEQTSTNALVMESTPEMSICQQQLASLMPSPPHFALTTFWSTGIFDSIQQG